MNTVLSAHISMGCLIGVIAAAAYAPAQTHTSEFPVPQTPTQANPPSPAKDKPEGSAGTSAGSLADAHVFAMGESPARRMANGGESRNIVHGTLATGETVNLHESTQPAGIAPNPAHVIHHSEFILIREGEVEFQHQLDGKMVAEKAGPGDVVYVAYGTLHTMRNIGNVPAKYTVVAIGGDAK